MLIGYVSLSGRGATDACLAAAVAVMQQRGLAIAGTVQRNLERSDRPTCDMDVRVMPDGPVLRISQDLGRHARGCRLDSAVLEQAVSEVARRIEGAALLVVNKFGKAEADGRGFVPLIAEAAARGLPVVVGVNGQNMPAFLRFAEGMATALPPDPVAIADWASQAALIHAA